VSPISKEYAQLITGRADFFSRKASLSPQDYFSFDTRIEIKNFWKILIQTERASECLRSRIAKRPNFNIQQAFDYSDRDLDGSLSALDIREMLSDHGFFATERELNHLMFKFDKDQDQKISYSEFVDEITPKLHD
jgi:Ca2+-binding EF-hand superfamily protein